MDRHDKALYEIRDIRRRIEKLRNSFRSTHRVYKSTPTVEGKSSVERTSAEQAQRDAEMFELKRKLIGANNRHSKT